MKNSFLQPLYKMDSAGRIRVWSIWVEGLEASPSALIVVEHGLAGGKLQLDEDHVTEGKNLGKSNETTPYQQACAEAQSKWTKQVEQKGYVTDRERALRGENDVPGPTPMLAHPLVDRDGKIKKNNLKKLKWPLAVQPKLDGCLQGFTKIKTDQGMIPIRDIVEKQMRVKVWSYNETTNNFEFKPIVNWFTNGTAEHKEWLDILPATGSRLRCTKNHKILTQMGWREAEALDPSIHKILASRNDGYRNSLILGTLLGDSCLAIEKRGSGNSYRIQFQHTNKVYLEEKIRILNLEGRIVEVITGYGSKAWRFVSKNLTNSGFPINDFYHMGNHSDCGKRKPLTYKKLKSLFSCESLALWIGDDGSLKFNNENKHTPILMLCTHGFTKTEVLELAQLFQSKYKCSPSVILDKTVKKEGCGYFLNFNTKDTLYLLNMLRDKQLRGVEYKFYFSTEGYCEESKDSFSFVEFKVKKASRMGPSIKYDLEVADNHNYVANDILVHNCRALAVIDNGNVKLWTRRGKPITAVPHIVEDLKAFMPEGFWILDGELYSHELKEDFETISSVVRKKDEIDQEKVMQYHIYDSVMNSNFLDRHDSVFAKILEYPHLEPKYLKRVETCVVNTLTEAKELLEEYLEKGYEGIMLRNIDAPYDNEVTRSYNLQKFKLFQEEEFPIVGVEEGRGKMKGLAIFICRTPEGNDFSVKMEGKLENLRQYWEDESTWKGKQLTVCFQKYSNKNNVPIFPTGKGVRDYE